MRRKTRLERGQVIFPLLGLFVVLLIALTIAFDFGRFLLLRSRVRTIADTAALAGAGALDIRQSASGAFSVNPAWAEERVQSVYQQTLSRNPKDTWMAISLGGVAVQGRSVTVTVTGQYIPVWGGAVGVGPFQTRVTATARAAVGITQER